MSRYSFCLNLRFYSFKHDKSAILCLSGGSGQSERNLWKIKYESLRVKNVIKETELVRKE